jgi:hypothetical protein
MQTAVKQSGFLINCSNSAVICQVNISVCNKYHVFNYEKNRAMWFTGIGTGGPAITAGVILLLNKIALALFTGLGPIFILSLLFEQTKQLFGKCLYYGIGTMFSLAVLSVMVGIALVVVTAVAASFWVGSFIGADNEGVNSMALQQGGLGLLLTMLIISAPPIAGNFFNGVMGSFLAHSQFGSFGGASNTSSSQAGLRGPGSPAVDNTVPRDSIDRVTTGTQAAPNRVYTGASPAAATDMTRAADQPTRGNAASISQQTAITTAPQVANTTSPQLIGPPVLPAPPQGSGGPPRGGTA